MKAQELKQIDKQPALFSVGGIAQDTGQNLPAAFKRIYYHLYSNSKASRAESIIEDLSLLLLSKLSAEVNGGGEELISYIGGKSTANSALVPMLRDAFPELDAPQKFALDDSSLRSALAELSDLKLSTAPAHALGEAFQALMGPRLRGEKGQFFTPKSLVRAMVEIIDPKPGESIVDPACGTGGFLAEAHTYQIRAYGGKALSGELVGVDKDSGLARLASALLKIVTGSRAKVYDFNSLAPPEWQDHTGQQVSCAYDVILTNPPFGAKIGIKDRDILSKYDFGHIWLHDKRDGLWVKTGAGSTSVDPQILFLEFCVRALKPNGRLGIVLPEGLFGNRNTSYVWDWLEAEGEPYALLDCPRTTFQPGTDTKTNVLFFKKRGKRKAADGADSKTRIAVALHCGHDRRGRTASTTGNTYPDDFLEIASTYKDPTSSKWRSVALKGHRYLVPRYYYEVNEAGSGEQEITSGARLATLGELIQEKVISIRKGHEVGSDAYGTGEIPFVRTSDLSNFEISSDPTKSVGEATYSEYAPQQELRSGDILIVVDGRYRIGTTAMLTDHNYRCVVQSHVRIISIIRKDLVDPHELLFALNLPSVKLRIRSLVFIQSTLGTLGNRLMELRVPLLHCEGPWKARVDKFRDVLQKRADLLAELSDMNGTDYEL